MPRRTRSAASASLRTGSAIVLASDSDSISITAASTRKKRSSAQRSEAMTESMSPPWVESSSAPRIVRRSLDRHADRDDRLARRVDANGRFGLSRQRVGDFRQRLAVGYPIVADAPLLGRREGMARFGPQPPPPRRAARSRSRRFGAKRRAARRKGLRIEQQQAVAIVDARARARRRHQAMEHRADAFGVDRELDRILVARRRRGVLARRELQQLLRIDGDGVGFDRRRRRRWRRR